MLARKDDLVNMKVPESFRRVVDQKRVEEGYNNRERAKFLRELCEEDDPFKKLKGTKKTKKNGSSGTGGIDFGF